jgi:hypothetical protein
MGHKRHSVLTLVAQTTATLPVNFRSRSRSILPQSFFVSIPFPFLQGPASRDSSPALSWAAHYRRAKSL